MRDTRYMIAEQAQRIIQGGTPTADSEVRLDELVIFVDQAFGQLVFNSFFQNRQDGINWIDGTFVYTFFVDVNSDTTRKYRYANIPSTYVSLPLGMGIVQVSDTQSEGESYIPVNPNFNALTDGLLVNNLGGRKAYFVENTNLYLMNLKTGFCPEKIMIKLAGGIQNEDELDPNVDLPLNMQKDIVAMTVQLYMEQRKNPHDVLNDNNKD
jgi:hypothetical protein